MRKASRTDKVIAACLHRDMEESVLLEVHQFVPANVASPRTSRAGCTRKRFSGGGEIVAFGEVDGWFLCD